MTKLIARVRTAEEAALAQAAGFDGVELPEGADQSGLVDAVRAAAGEGFAVCWPAPNEAAPGTPGHAGVTWLSDGNRRRFAVSTDHAPSDAELDVWAASAIAGVILQSKGRLLDTIGLPELAALTAGCRARGLSACLGGSLELPDIPRLLAIAPDYLLFGRTLRRDETLNATALRMVRDLVPPALRAGAAVKARDLVADAACAPRDRIFVRDMVLPMAVGAYASERGRTQRVRFSVEADLASLGRPARDMRDIVSYDLIMDAITDIVVRGHVDLVETLAERIASRVLGFPRVARVHVMVEKLDLGPGAVGAEIWRDAAGTDVA